MNFFLCSCFFFRLVFLFSCFLVSFLALDHRPLNASLSSHPPPAVASFYMTERKMSVLCHSFDSRPWRSLPLPIRPLPASAADLRPSLLRLLQIPLGHCLVSAALAASFHLASHFPFSRFLCVFFFRFPSCFRTNRSFLSLFSRTRFHHPCIAAASATPLEIVLAVISGPSSRNTAYTHNSVPTSTSGSLV